jgi:hypothetical protein
VRAFLAGLALLLTGATTLPAQAMRSFSTSRPARAGDPSLLRTTLDFGAGRVVLRAGAPDQLYRMQLRYDAERFAPIHDYEPAIGALHLGLDQQGRGGIRVTSRAQLEQVARFEFSPQVPLELTANLGASEATLDLGDLTIAALLVRSGATRGMVDFSRPTRGECRGATFAVGATELSVMYLANAGCAELRVEGGVGRAVLDFSGTWRRNPRLSVALAMGTLTLRVPRGTGVRIRGDKVLTSIAGEGLARASDTWSTTDFATATRTVDIELKTSVAGVELAWID